MLVNIWTVKNLVKYPCISLILHQCKWATIQLSSMLFVLLFMFNTSQDPANTTWVHNCSRGKCEKAFHWVMGFPTKLWLAREETNKPTFHTPGNRCTSRSTMTMFLVWITRSGCGGSPITDLECRHPWSYFASFWYFAGSWLVLNINSQTNYIERKLVALYNDVK